MADYTDSKFGVGAIHPAHAIETSTFDRLEPLITPLRVRREFLFGIPLVSNIKDPITGLQEVMDDTLISDIILRAVSNVEVDTRIDVFPVKRHEKQAFDRNAYESLGYFKLEHRPASSIDQLAVVPSNNIEVYDVPLDWVETAYLDRGQINIVPLTIAFQNGGFIPSQSAGGAMFLAILGQKNWIPAFWRITYTSGFPDGALPREINSLIGVYAAMDILSQLAATYATNTSHSISYDSMSQSVSTPGPQLFATRMQDLEKQKMALLGKVKARYNFKLFSSTL